MPAPYRVAVNGSVKGHMAAPPERSRAFIGDVTRIGMHSPESLEGECPEGAIGPAAGARFRERARRNGTERIKAEAE